MAQAVLSSVRITTSLRLRSDLHIARKLWHMLTGLIGLVLYSRLRISQDHMATALLVISALGFSIDFLRLRNEKINEIVIKIMKPFMRESEKKGLSGLPFYALGVSLSLFFFPEKIAILSVLFLIFADPIASFFGILYGKDKILPNKSLQGTIAAFAVCYTVTLIYGLVHLNPSMALLVFAIFGGAIGAISELCSQFVDDNLCIPVISGLGLFLVNLIMQII